MSNRDIEISVRLTADGKGLIGEARVVRDALGGVGDATRKATNDSAGFTAQTQQQSAATGQAGASLGNLKTGLIAAAGAYVTLGNNTTFLYLINETLIALENRHPGIIKEISQRLNSFDPNKMDLRDIGPIYHAQNILHLNFPEHAQAPKFPRI